MKFFCISLSLFFSAFSLAQTSPPHLNSILLIVPEKDTVETATSTYRLSASTAPGSKVSVNGKSYKVYPSGALHRVAPVTRGTRFAAVGWARSYVRGSEPRELLFDLDTARRALFAREGKSREFDLLSKCSANLLRAWAED